MKTNEFIGKLKDALEIKADKAITEETDLRELNEYDSLSMLSIIAMIDESFEKRLSGLDFESITTVRSLMELIGKETFE